MPFIVLVTIGLCAGLILTLAFARVSPSEAAIAAAKAAMEQADDSPARSWWQRRTDPQMLTGLALTAAVGLLIAGGAVVGILAYLVRGNSAVRSVDASAANWGHDHATLTSTRLLTWVTDLGDAPLIAIIAVALVLYELRRSPNRWIVPFVLVVALGDQLITHSIKQLADRARPTLSPLAATLGPSFPSGHSSTAASLYAALALILARGRRRRTQAWLFGAAGGLAVSVAASRVLLDVHWLSDVIAGVMLGWAWFALCAIAFGGRHMRFGEPLEEHEGAAPTAGSSPARAAPPAAEV